MSPIHRLHHSAYGCADAEATRAFYEDFLGLPLVRAMEIRGLRGRDRSRVLQLHFRIRDGSLLAFFETRDRAFAPHSPSAQALHLAFDVDTDDLPGLRTRAAAAGFETQTIGEHGRLQAVHLRDPNGYVVELCGRCSADTNEPDVDDARRVLARWQEEKGAPDGTPAR